MQKTVLKILSIEVVKENVLEQFVYDSNLIKSDKLHFIYFIQNGIFS